MASHADGILFDTAYVEPEIWLWVLTPRGLLSVSTEFTPLFYLAGPKRVVDCVAANSDQGVMKPVGWTSMTDFWTGSQQPVLACKVLKAHAVTGAVRRLLHQDHRLRAYDVDVDPCLSFHSLHDLFPLAKVALSWEEENSARRLVHIRALDDPWEPEYRLPNFRTMKLRLARSPLVALGRGNWVVGEADGEKFELRPKNEAKALQNFNQILREHDPDVLVTQRGDQFIFPWLLEASGRCKMPLALDRSAPHVERHVQREGKTLWVYSGIQYKAPDYPLLGRWHLDLKNSFFADKAGIEGVVEMSRLSRLPVQRQARTSGGTAITAMEIHLALKRRVLVPFIKDQVESFRTAFALLQEDKGGLTYYPPVGLFENVLELDFHQMYPTIMAVHNVSPETMDCRCCVGKQPVPGTSHHTCTKRRGLVPDALQGLLTKRLRYKELIKSSSGEMRQCYETRATALKWTLVTTFGYQGFHNAKFGLIAAHEAITAWGRESLLRAKEVFEAAGFRLLHALTDSLYVHKPTLNMEEVERLTAEVGKQTRLALGVEGVYDWIAFLPSKMREMSVATRYFGRFSTGELKVRGIKVRQHSTSPFIRTAQNKFLAILAHCRSGEALEAAQPVLKAACQQYAALLWQKQVQPEDLLLTARVSKEAGAYRSNSPVAVCLRSLAKEGIRIPPGQTIRYVIAARKHPNPEERYVPDPLLDKIRHYDAPAYEALLLDAFNEVASIAPTDRSKSIAADGLLV